MDFVSASSRLGLKFLPPPPKKKVHADWSLGLLALVKIYPHPWVFEEGMPGTMVVDILTL